MLDVLGRIRYIIGKGIVTNLRARHGGLLIFGEASLFILYDEVFRVAMNKPFKTYRQQLRILRDRNLAIHDGSKAIDILRKEGYYNIINGYKDIFLDQMRTQQTGQDYYKNETTFEQIYALYDFDRNLRSILIKYILKVETSLKTKLAYKFSETFAQNFSYLDINNYDSSDPQKVTKLIARLSQVITNNSEQSDQGGQIYHYLDKYKELPLWVLTKKMTLGETYHFFDVLQPRMKDDIIDECLNEYAKDYPQATIQNIADRQTCFSNILKFLNTFRNICAHDERLYNTLKKDKRNRIPRIVLFHKHPLPLFKSRLFDCILIVGLFVSKKDYKQLIRNLTSSINDLQKQLPQSSFNAVLIQMGFSRNWETDLQLP